MNSSVQGAQSFTRSIAVLQMIAESAHPLNRAELASRSDLTRPTLYRIIASLEAEGLIRPTSQGGYGLGVRLVALARTALAQNDIRGVAGPELERLRDVTGETVHLAVPSSDAMVYIDKIESRETVRMMSTIGSRIPFHSTSVGRAYLSALPEADANALIDRIETPAITDFTVTDLNRLKDIVRQARLAGVAREEQENERGIICFGAAIRDRTQAPVAAISVSVPMFRLDETRGYEAAILRAADEISKGLSLIDA